MNDCLDQATMRLLQTARRRYADMRIPPHILKRYRPRPKPAAKGKK
jgi:hypothetical protein